MPKLSPNATYILRKRYLARDGRGRVVETPYDLFRRVAHHIAFVERHYNSQGDVSAWEERFYNAMVCLEFLPNSPTLLNAGRLSGQLASCFMLPVSDSDNGIFHTLREAVIVHQSGGGTGFCFSGITPQRTALFHGNEKASGPVAFVAPYSEALDAVKQGGIRRGCSIVVLDVRHPDILEFICAKDNPQVLPNFYLAVGVTEQFMQAVVNNDAYELINPETGNLDSRQSARKVFDCLVAQTWKTGDPGIVFLDRIERDNPTPHLGRIAGVSGCGEQPLLPYESCNLGSINLSRMLMAVSGGGTAVDYDKLKDTVHLAVRFLDNVIDMNKFPLPQIEEVTKKTRKIGLGVMGFADMLIQLGIPYDSEEALKTAEDVMSFINREAHKASEELAKERGCFPAYEGSIYDRPGGVKMRNASLTTIAPTGTLSIIAGCSSGIEPLFGLVYTRHILDGASFLEINQYFGETARSGGFYSEDIMQKLASGTPLADIGGVPEKYRRIFVTAHDIGVEWHVRMQAAFQHHTDNAVSKTVNFAKEATQADVAHVYLMAYEEGLKGITIYRDGSRTGQVLTTGTAIALGHAEPSKATAPTPRRRSRVTTGATERVTTGCGYIYVTVNSDDTGICEVFSHLGKTGGCAAAQLESTCRLISLALRSGVDIAAVVKQLKGIRCPSIAWEDGKSILSCADAIAGVLERQAGFAQGCDGKRITQDFGLVKNVAGQCPECTSLLAYEEGCLKCPGCGYTKC